jgi:hypothetical protein
MELAGDEKRIQALFRELKLEDERVAPEFIRLWSRAQATKQKPRPTLKTSFAVAAILLVVTLFALAFWLRNWQDGQPQSSALASGSTMPGSTPALSEKAPEPKQPLLDRAPDRIKINRPARKLARRQIELVSRNAAFRHAVAISTWQSPTATFMQSPVDDMWTSAPQFGRSVSEFKSFLGKQSKVKESQ